MSAGRTARATPDLGSLMTASDDSNPAISSATLLAVPSSVGAARNITASPWNSSSIGNLSCSSYRNASRRCGSVVLAISANTSLTNASSSGTARKLVAALRELLHLFQEIDGAFEEAGEIEHRVRLECLVVLRQRQHEEAPHAARQDDVEVAPERAHSLFDCWSDSLDGLAMALPPRFGPAMLLLELR